MKISKLNDPKYIFERVFCPNEATVVIKESKITVDRTIELCKPCLRDLASKLDAFILSNFTYFAD